MNIEASGVKCCFSKYNICQFFYEVCTCAFSNLLHIASSINDFAKEHKNTSYWRSSSAAVFVVFF